MPLIANLALGQAAINFVTGKLPYGADNNLTDLAMRRVLMQYPAMTVKQHRDGRRALLPGCYAQSGEPRSNLALVILEAYDAMLAKQGNCSEHASLAFYDLTAELEQKGIARYGLRGQDAELHFNHAFVIRKRSLEDHWQLPHTIVLSRETISGKPSPF